MLRWKIQRRGDIHARAQGMIGIGNHRLHRHIASVLANPGLDRIDMAREAAFRPGIRLDGHGGAHMQLGKILLRSEEHTSELQSLMSISYAVFCLKKKTRQYRLQYNDINMYKHS